MLEVNTFVQMVRNQWAAIVIQNRNTCNPYNIIAFWVHLRSSLTHVIVSLWYNDARYVVMEVGTDI